jgi:hypothetical protein
MPVTLATISFLHSQTFNSQLTAAPSRVSLPCRAQLSTANPQLTVLPHCLLYNNFAWTNSKTLFLTITLLL